MHCVLELLGESFLAAGSIALRQVQINQLSPINYDVSLSLQAA